MKILLVDDEEVIHQAIGPFIKHLGHHLRSATNSIDALRLVEDEVPDIVFSDIKMPDMSGIELLEKLRARVPTLPVVLITGYGNIDTAIDSLHQGAYDYLRKPLKLDDIVALLKRVEILNNYGQSTTRAQAKIASRPGPITVDTLASGIVHALNDPTAEIRTDLQIFQKIATSDEWLYEGSQLLQLVDHLLCNVERITHILEQVQLFNKSQTNGAIGQVNLHDCLDEAVAQTTAQRRNILLEKHYQQHSIRGIAGELTQLFTNLLSNAAQAIGDRPGGKIAVDIKVREPGWTTVVVEDNGVGIADEVADRIFDPFFTTRTTDEAAGLGLSICHSIAARHEGYIGFNSDLGKGSRFWVILPTTAMDHSVVRTEFN